MSVASWSRENVNVTLHAVEKSYMQRRKVCGDCRNVVLLTLRRENTYECVDVPNNYLEIFYSTFL